MLNENDYRNETHIQNTFFQPTKSALSDFHNMLPQLHIGNYTLLYTIGSGSFGSVYMGINDLVGYPVAIKQIEKKSITTEKGKLHVKREISIMKKAMHQFIVELFEIIDEEDSPYLYLIMELVEHGSIKSLLEQDQPIKEDLARKIFAQLILAVGYLHFGLKVIHRDLKAENILFDKNQNIRLIDFGLSTTLFQQSADIQRTACGSPAYAAPEIIMHDNYTESADIWSLGILLFLMSTGRFPFDTNSVTKLLNDIISQPIEIPSDLPPDLQDLLSKILQKDPELRLTLTEIMNHPWFTHHGYFNFYSPRRNTVNDQLEVAQFAAPHMSDGDETSSNISPYNNIDKFNISSSTFTLSMMNSPNPMAHFDSFIVDDSIDLDIINELKRKKVDITNLKADLMNHTYSEASSAYRILRRAKIMEHFDNSVCLGLNTFSDNSPILRIKSYPNNGPTCCSTDKTSAITAISMLGLGSGSLTRQQVFAKQRSTLARQTNLIDKRTDVRKRRAFYSIPKHSSVHVLQMQMDMQMQIEQQQRKKQKQQQMQALNPYMQKPPMKKEP